jgi:hypothetical protein
MTPKDMVDNLLVRAEYVRRYADWFPPLSTLKDEIESMTDDRRQAHYLDIRSIVDSTGFKKEMDEWKRRVTRTLALGASGGAELNDVQRMGLRFLLVEIDIFQESLIGRAAMLRKPKPLKSMTDSI